MKSWRFDAWRIAILAAVTAALALGVAAALDYHSSHTAHTGPTSATLDEGFSWIAGSCLGLGIGSFAAAALVRQAPRLASGAVVGILAFVVAVAPYLLLTSPRDVSTSDDVGFVVIVFVPAALIVMVGAALGAAARSGSDRSRKRGRD